MGSDRCRGQLQPTAVPVSSENFPLLNRGKYFCGLIRDAHQHEYWNFLQLFFSSVSLNLVADIYGGTSA